jgi:hypothetical protein
MIVRQFVRPFEFMVMVRDKRNAIDPRARLDPVFT